MSEHTWVCVKDTYFSLSSSFGRFVAGLDWRERIMESSEVTCCGNRVEDDEAGRSENEDERRFKLGELVEFWGGVSVRGYRTDSGAPAWVKADYGLEEYGIKMVGNTRGKLRRVQWKQLFKDGSFNKLQMRVRGPRDR